MKDEGGRGTTFSMTALPTITPLGSFSSAPSSIIPTCSASSIIQRGTGVPPALRSIDQIFSEL